MKAHFRIALWIAHNKSIFCLTEKIKPTEKPPDFCSCPRLVRGRNLLALASDATQSTDKKTGKIENFDIRKLF